MSIQTKTTLVADFQHACVITAAHLGSGGGTNISCDDYTFVGGGRSNTASAAYAVVTGGCNNTASCEYSSVVGGSYNSISAYYSFIGGGYSNTVTCGYAVVSGGSYNTASGYYATVSGGYNNTASGRSSTVSGGYHNTASGYYSTVAGGCCNIADGCASGILGGECNCTGGFCSAFIVGSNLVATAACTTFMNNVCANLGYVTVVGPQPQIITKVASATVRNSYDASANTTNAGYVKVKTITLGAGLLGQQRFLFDIGTSLNTSTAYGQIYRNGVALGTEQTSTNDAGFDTKSEDITQDWSPGDTAELWIHIDGSETVTVRNFRIAYDDAAVVAVNSSNS